MAHRDVAVRLIRRVLLAAGLWVSLCASLWMAQARALEPPAAVVHELKVAGIPLAATAILVHELDAPLPTIQFNAETALNPASTMKLLTTFAALELLGPAFVWQTEAYVDGTLIDGILSGNLYLRGGGDPKLTYDQFSRFLRQIRARGVREIAGDLVLDRSAFSVGDSQAARFDAQPLRPYNVVPDALLLNFKAIRVSLLPDSESKKLIISMEPAPVNLDLVNQIRLTHIGAPVKETGCGDWKEGLRADVVRRPTVTRLVLTGHYSAACGEQIWNLSVQDNSQFVLGVFRQLWAELGGTLSGSVRDGAIPHDARLLTSFVSPPLAEVVRDINKFSNNVMARQLLLSLGLEAGHRPARPEDGAAAIIAWLESKGLQMPELVLENGAGLSRIERISATNLARLLQAAWKSPVMPELMSSLPVAALDGTMKKRLKNNGIAGQAHIKTGSLEGVKTLAGYVLDKNGRRWIVVFLVNHPNSVAAQPAMDTLLQWVWQDAANVSNSNVSSLPNQNVK